jgi:hypothetical protein
MTDRFAVLLRSNEIKDNTTLMLFVASAVILLCFVWVRSLPIPEDARRQVNFFYTMLGVVMWALWLGLLASMRFMP